MAVSNEQARAILARLLRHLSVDESAERLSPRDRADHPLPPRIPHTGDWSSQSRDDRIDVLRDQQIELQDLLDDAPAIAPQQLQGNIENYVGMARVPVGVIGPLRVNGAAACGDFYVPLATTEGALVASCQRGALLASMSGGVTSVCFTETVYRAPCFMFENMIQAGYFLAWLLPQTEQMQALVEQTTSHGKLQDVQTSIVGKEIYLKFEYSTGDAGGQNMVTIATQAICDWILENTPVQPADWFLDGNMSGDKKATTQAFAYARGKKVVGEATIPAGLVKRFLHTDVEQMFRYWQVSAMGGVQSGSIGIQGHYANPLTAMFIACGQDPACVAEAAVGITRVDITPDKDLYISVSLPNLICGTVGGGTGLPTARECLAMMDCEGVDKARKFAEICCATVLAAELSIIGSMAAGDFSKAHEQFGRKK